MIRIGICAAAVALSLASVAAQAQQNPQSETMPSHTDGNSNGTAPGGMGSSGWTGGTGGSHIGTSNSQTTGEGTSSSAPPGPETATGQDLKGPPVQFPANKTPE